MSDEKFGGTVLTLVPRTLVEDPEAVAKKASCLTILEEFRNRVEDGSVTELAIVGIQTGGLFVRWSRFSDGIKIVGAMDVLKRMFLNENLK